MRLGSYYRLMRLDRPVGTLLLLWPTLAALWLASGGVPPPGLIGVFVLGTLLMRSAGCVVNDLADRKFDAHVQRTRNRPLATGELSPKSAIVLFALLCLAAGSLLILLNNAARLLAVAGLGIAVLYPFLKRWTNLPQLALGVAFSWGILMAFAAAGGGTAHCIDLFGGHTPSSAKPTVADFGLESFGRDDCGGPGLAMFLAVLAQIPFAGWVLFAASAVWIVAYDTLYAMADREDDLKIGVKSTAVLLGRHDRLAVGVLQAGALAGFATVGVLYNFGWWYAAAIAASAGLFAHQQMLIRERESAACLKAFLNNTWVGFGLFAGVVAELAAAN